MATNHYVKNSELREEIIRCKKNDVLSEEAINMFIILAKKYSNKYQYMYEEDREDCISFAVMDCYLYWRGYDPERSQNAFAYYTQIVKNGFAKGWRRLYGNLPKSRKISLSTNNIYNI
jgi:DNA-directed RNA polymerase specialized sigma subunit